MRRPLWTCCSILTFFFVLSVRADAPPAAPAPHTLPEILSNAQPYKLYADAYGAFQFESNSSLTVGTEGDNMSFEGHSLLKRNEHGDFQLLREPLMGSSQVELKFIKSKTYIRSQGGKEFNRVRYQKEFDRWLNENISEIFTLFQKEGFGDLSQGTVKNSTLCYQKKEGSICVDPATGMPSSGTLTVSRKDKSSPRLEFKVTLFAPNVVTIPEP